MQCNVINVSDLNVVSISFASDHSARLHFSMLLQTMELTSMILVPVLAILL